MAARYYRDCVERRTEFTPNEFLNEHPEHYTKSFEPYLLNTALYYWNCKTVSVKEKAEEIDANGNARTTITTVYKPNPNFVTIPVLERLCEELHVKNFIEKLKSKYQKQKFDPILYNVFKSAIKKRTNWIKDLEMFSKNGHERLRWLSLWGAAILESLRTPDGARRLLGEIHAPSLTDDEVGAFFATIPSPELPKPDKRNRKERRAELREKRKEEREAKKAERLKRKETAELVN
ncbi:hypothetical protein BNJ_00261 [Kaumoebavirus]|uniref:hypothetical protein n=1 Tax=Kaumoebavirus TaxID=1859492 RepID=UPI0009C1DBFA|nr:hypothetical protein BNJ_00261 [Kaumoebavirus]ARA72086.1 hypothetical protein BNJ_00261 [Kaumoebavirus]